jgi:hypothetical protein
MTVDEYFAYVRDYQRRLYDAVLQATQGVAEPTFEDREDLDALYEEEEEAFLPFTDPVLFCLLDEELVERSHQ